MRVIEGQRSKNLTLFSRESYDWVGPLDDGMTRDIFGNFLMEVSEMNLKYNDEP